MTLTCPQHQDQKTVQGGSERRLKSSGGTATGLAVVVAMALVVAAAQPAASAPTIAVDSERHGDAIDVHASVVLNADAATAWRVLTDYNRYTEFIPDLRLSRVVSRRGATLTVEQSGDGAFGVFKMPLDITFEIAENSPNSLQSRAVAGTLRALTSSYALTLTGPGIRLDYVGRIEPGFALFGHIEQTVVERNVGRQFQALADEIDRQGATARLHSMAGVK